VEEEWGRSVESEEGWGEERSGGGE